MGLEVRENPRKMWEISRFDTVRQFLSGLDKLYK